MATGAGDIRCAPNARVTLLAATVTSGHTRDIAAQEQRTTPVGPLELVRHAHAAHPLAAKPTGDLPDGPGRRRRAKRDRRTRRWPAAVGCRPACRADLSLLAHMADTSARPRAAVCSRAPARSASPSEARTAVTRWAGERDGGTSVFGASQPSAVQDGVAFGRRWCMRAAAGVAEHCWHGRRPVDAPWAARVAPVPIPRGEDHLRWPRTQGRRAMDSTRLLHPAARAVRPAVCRRRRVADAAEHSGHRPDGSRQHRGGGGVVEITPDGRDSWFVQGTRRAGPADRSVRPPARPARDRLVVHRAMATRQRWAGSRRSALGPSNTDMDVHDGPPGRHHLAESTTTGVVADGRAGNGRCAAVPVVVGRHSGCTGRAASMAAWNIAGRKGP